MERKPGMPSEEMLRAIAKAMKALPPRPFKRLPKGYVTESSGNVADGKKLRPMEVSPPPQDTDA